MKRALACLAVVAWSGACAEQPERPALAPVGVTADAPTSPAPQYAFDSLDGRPVASGAFRGRPVVLTFFDTANVGCQAQANFLATMAKHDGDRVAYAMVALEPRTQRELVELYKSKLALPFPVALADDATLKGEGPFGPIPIVPTTFVLDARGEVRARKVGLVKPDELRSALP